MLVNHKDDIARPSLKPILHCYNVHSIGTKETTMQVVLSKDIQKSTEFHQYKSMWPCLGTMSMRTIKIELYFHP